MKELINWTDEAINRVLEMQARGMMIKEIAEEMGKPPKAIYQMLYRRRNGFVRTRSLFSWAAADIEELRRLCGLGLSTREIAEAMGRTESAVQSRISRARLRPAMMAKDTQPAPVMQRVPIAQYTSLTALLCGDPLPGRSALDRREASR